MPETAKSPLHVDTRQRTHDARRMIEHQRSANRIYHWTAGIWHYWVMVLLTIIWHYPLLVPGIGMPHWGDFYCFHSPMRIAAAQALHRGEIPYITQAIYGGYPLFSDPQFAFFYPVNFLFSLLVPNPNGEVPLDGYVFANLMVLSLAAVFFVRSFGFGRLAALVAAVLIAFNGFVQMHITHINILQVMATGYLAAGFLMRLGWSGGYRWRMAVWAGLALAAGNLAGHPQTTMFLHYALGLGMLAVAVELWRRTGDRAAVVRILAWSAVAVVIGLAVAAVQLLPTGHLLQSSARMHMGRIEAMDEAVRAWHLPSMLFPGFYIPLRWDWGWPMYVPHHISWMVPNPLEGLTFGGVVAFALGLVGFISYWRRPSAQLLFWSSVFLVLASLGAQTPVYGFLYDYVPMVDKVRVPSRVLWLFYTTWALLMAMAVRACMEGRARTAARATFIVLALGLWFGALAVVGAYRTSWFGTFVRIFVEDKARYMADILREPHVFAEAVREQALFGAIFVTFTMVWLFWLWRRGGSRGAVAAAGVVVAVELFTYGFARSYVMDVPPRGVVIADSLNVLPEEPAGRGLVPAFQHGGGAINMAMVEGGWLANGYSVTYPTWVRAFEPLDVPPYRLRYEETLLDLWNVSDIVLPKRGQVAKMGGLDVPLDDWGWAEIGSPWHPDTDETSVSVRARMPETLTIPLDNLTTPVVWVQVLCTSVKTLGMADGTEVARAYAVPRDDSATSIPFSLRLGEDLGEAYYWQEVQRGLEPKHKQPPVALVRKAQWEPSDGTQLYFVPLEMPTATPLSALVFEAVAPYPSIFALSQVLVGMEDGYLEFKRPHGLEGVREVESPSAEYRLLRNDDIPGFAYMVPAAQRGSYKEPGHIMWRMFNGEFDLRREVIVDKRKYKEEDAAQVDATRPQDYNGTATIKWHRPDHVEVKTKANDQGWLVLSMTWDEGWSAWLDGEEIDLARANGPFCAVPVPAGEHTVVLRYKPVNFIAGAVLSTLSLAGCLVALLWRRGRRRRQEAVSAG